MKDTKLLDALEIDYENNKVKVNFENLYPDIDIPETLSNLLGKWITKITPEYVELEDGEKVNINNETPRCQPRPPVGPFTASAPLPLPYIGLIKSYCSARTSGDRQFFGIEAAKPHEAMCARTVNRMQHTNKLTMSAFDPFV